MLGTPGNSPDASRDTGEISGLQWGLETDILQITHDAIITSLLRRGLLVTGSSIPPELLSTIGTNVTYVAARRILGLDRTVRIETLLFLAAASSYQNLTSNAARKWSTPCFVRREAPQNSD